MHSLRTIHNLADIQAQGKPVHLAIGMFDGVHLGHQAVIESAVHSAHRDDGLSAVLTFHPHPSRLFRPQNPTPLVLPDEDKARRIGLLGVDILIQKEFTTDFASLDGTLFIPYLKEKIPTLTSVYVGADFRFGKGRSGDVNTLIQSGNQHGVSLYSLHRITHNGEDISSTRIRQLLQSGNIEYANTLLGYDYQAYGTITKGKQLGRTLGFPTLNLPWTPELTPCFGVYAVTVESPKQKSFSEAVANYGIRPTIEKTDSPILEIHILGDTQLDAGDEIIVRWKHFIRSETQFPNIDALKAQITKDCNLANKFFERTCENG